ncbi:hypothetical protein I203_106832 [Kwoniella mangroviensis CBS 8507]|uniref:uncharacterized protein n=1 Tax=Kwoniella mangroviensis CBS 8507 TaxID=1296122 RepID=UPI00080CD67F|nr:uncharacterized protein I203_08313 [Kwoniella mangroviensis CBS 8507]OCF62630.1 hypothetical protein I203_08313 [Kwoniella mangroviensis CBS 8507]
MRFFTSCESARTHRSSTDTDLGDEVGDRENGWDKYEKTWEDQDPEGRWKRKVWVRKWSNTSSGDGEENQSPFFKRGHGHGHGRIDDDSDHKKEDAKPVGQVNASRGNNDEGASFGAGDQSGNESSKSRNLLILDTILRTTYRAGYNDALKIKPFLPYSDSTSPSLPPSANSNIGESTNPNNGVYLVGGLVVLFTGMVSYKTYNRMKEVNKGLQEVLALVELTRSNEASAVGKLGRELIGIKKLLEDGQGNVRSRTENDGLTKNSDSDLWKDVKHQARPNQTPFENSLSIKSSNTQLSGNIHEVDIKLILNELKNDLKKEFRMISKDFNAQQGDLVSLKTDLEAIQQSLVKSSSSPGIADGTSKILEEIIKLNTASHLLSDKLSNLSTSMIKDISGEVSLTNQLSKQGLNKLDEIGSVLEGLGRELKEVKEKSNTTSKVGRPKASSSSSSGSGLGGSGSVSGGGGESSSTQSADVAAMPAFVPSISPSQSRPKSVHSAGLGLGIAGGHNDVMPLGDIRKAIEGVRKSYMDDQSRQVSETLADKADGKETSATTDIKSTTPRDQNDALESSSGSGLGPTEGINFQTPLDKVKNPYRANTNIDSPSETTGNPATSSTKSRASERKDDEDEDPPSPPPPAPPTQSRVTPETRRNRQSQQHAHWWTVHSLPHAHINDLWRIKGFGWYQPSSSAEREPGQVKKDRNEEDRSIGAWAVGRVRRRFGDWPFH